MINPEEIRADFPILSQTVNGRPLAYLDNAATTQKPRQVIEAVARYYETSNANVHRAIHTLGERATQAYEGARERVARFIDARDAREVVFTRNATEALNLVAYAWGLRRLGPDDEIVTTLMEHHSNFVPWQQVAAARGARLRVMGQNPNGTLLLDTLGHILNERTRLVAVTHASNVLGTINPVAEIAEKAHAVGALVVVDGAQSVPHMPVDVTAFGCDFFAFSGNKMLGPTGIGVLWGRRELLEAMDPFLYGGDMIASVQLNGSTWNEAPYKFEAGTPNIAGAVGLAAAIDYLEGIGMDAIFAHEQSLVAYARKRLEEIVGLKIYGPRGRRSGLLAFNLAEVHPHDVATVLNEEGVAIRAGHHCAQPLMDWLEVPATNRASFYIYNTEADVDRLTAALVRTKEFFGHVVR